MWVTGKIVGITRKEHTPLRESVPRLAIQEKNTLLSRESAPVPRLQAIQERHTPLMSVARL
jgi:hypothetical protein